MNNLYFLLLKILFFVSLNGEYKIDKNLSALITNSFDYKFKSSLTFGNIYVRQFIFYEGKSENLLNLH